MKTKVLTTIVSAFVATVTFADDTVYSLSDRTFLIEQRVSQNEEKLKVLSVAAEQRHEDKVVQDFHIKELQREVSKIKTQVKAIDQTQNKIKQRLNQEVISGQIATYPQQGALPYANWYNSELITSPYTGVRVKVHGLQPHQVIADPVCGKRFRVPLPLVSHVYPTPYTVLP